MFEKLLSEFFPELEFDQNDKIFDHINKNCFIIKNINISNDINYKLYFKNDLLSVYYKDYDIIGILIINNVPKLIDINIYDNKVLILLGSQENILQILKDIIININLLFIKNSSKQSDRLSFFDDLIRIKTNILEITEQINELLSKNFKNILDFPKEKLYRELLFSDKINQKKILAKYSNYITNINDIKVEILNAKEYFKNKNSN